MPLLAAFALAMPAGAALAPPAVAATQAQAAALGQRVLRAGSTGNDVRRLQALLARTGLKVGQDGEFGPATAKAVQTFQSVTGLGVTGVVDATTARYLITATSGGRTAQAANNGGVNRATFTVKTKALGDRLPVRRGMSGRDVKMLQDFLRRAGVRRVTVDGEFGGGTLRAVRTWEGSVRRKIDGVVDAGDVARLR